MEMLEHIAKVGSIIIAAGTVVGAVITGVIGYLSYVKTFKQAAQMLLFIKYTDRYEKIMASYPTEALSVRLDNHGEPPPASEPLSLAAIKYLNLSSEEFYVWKKGYLGDEVWEIWEEELKRTLRSPLYKREWSKLRKEFETYKEFLDYVEGVQREAVPLPSQPDAQLVSVDRPSTV